MKYKRYSTTFKLFYKLGLLPHSKTIKIRNSTLKYWRDSNYSNYIGIDLTNFESDTVLLLEFRIEKLAKTLKTLRYYCALLKMVLMSRKRYLKEVDRYKDVFVSVIDRLKSKELPLTKICYFLGISPKKYYYWKRITLSCGLSVKQLCFKRHPNQLMISEIQTIKDYCKKYRGEYFNTIYYRMRNDGKAFMSISTFYLYCKLLEISRYIKKKKYNKIGIRASKPFQVLHMDVTILTLKDNTKAYIYILMDNFSRFILSARASISLNSEECKKNVKSALLNSKIPFPDKIRSRLICDGGSENKGFVDIFLNESPFNILKQVASQINFSNSMVEATNKRLKYQQLFHKEFENFSSFQRQLPEIIEASNYLIPQGALHGCIPFEVLLKKKIPDKNRFAQQIKQSQKNRIKTNQIFACGSPCS